MKKFFSCMIMAAVVLGMASCGEALDPNDPNEYCFIVTYDADGDPVTLNVWATNSEMLEEVLPGIAADGYIPKYKKVNVQSERECDYYTEYVDDEEDEPTMTPEEMIVGQWYYGERGNNNYLTFYKDNSCYFNSNSEVGYDPYTHTGTWRYVASEDNFKITWTSTTWSYGLDAISWDTAELNEDGTELYYGQDTYQRAVR